MTLVCLGHFARPDRFHAGAMEFDINAQRTVLRRLQFCQDCGSALLVTRVRPGVAVRCPDCGKEQPRLADAYLLTQVYQFCRLCEQPLDSAGHRSGDVVECDNCHTRQTLSPDAFPSGENVSGAGYAPGFPPGSGKKRLLFSPERPDAVLTAIPLDDDGGGPALVQPRTPSATIPRPPARPPDSPPAREAAPGRWVPSPARPPPGPEIPRPPLPALETADSPPAPGSDPVIASIRTPGVVDVPAVSVDMFGGGGPKARPAASPTTSRAADGLLARVDGKPIFVTDVDRVAAPAVARWRERAASGGPPVTPERERELRREILERLIDRELAVGEAANLGLRPDPAAIRRREAELAAAAPESGVNIRREAERDIVMAEIRRVFAEKPAAASPGAVRDFYRSHQAELTRPRQLAMRHLVVYRERASRRDGRNVQDIAGEISARLESGARFDDLQRKYDEFPAAAGVPPPEPVLLPETAFAGRILASAGHLGRGAVFGPVMLEGMALFGKIEDDRPAGPIPFEEAEKDIRIRLEREAAERNFEDWLKRLRQRGVVEFFLDP